VDRSLDRALNYYKEAADGNNGDAMHTLAFFLASGYGGRPVDDGASLIWEESAALLGNVPAGMGLGYRYLYGYGVAQDCERALLFYKVRWPSVPMFQGLGGRQLTCCRGLGHAGRSGAVHRPRECLQ
jgi:hypothetical protein